MCGGGGGDVCVGVWRKCVWGGGWCNGCSGTYVSRLLTVNSSVIGRLVPGIPRYQVNIPYFVTQAVFYFCKSTVGGGIGT